MEFNLEEWATRSNVGKGFAADVGGKWCSFLEIKNGAYRGDHSHPYDQYTVLLGGSIMTVKEIAGELIELILQENVIYMTPKGVPHINVALEDAVLYEWWDGPFESDQCPGLFDKYKEGRVGPRD